MVKKISYNEIKELFFPLPKTIISAPQYEYYAVFDGDKAVSMGAVHNDRVHCLYTPTRFRGLGYCTELMHYIVENKLAHNALCTADSYEIFLKCGFCLKKVIHRQNSKGEKYILWEVDYGTT